MKRFLLSLLILLIAAPLWAQEQTARMSPMIVGGGVPEAAGDPCATGTATEIVSIVYDGNARDFDTFTVGQGFTGTAEPFYSISVYTPYNASTGLITCRLGTTTDLTTTYTDSVAITTSTGAGYYEGVSSICPTLSTGTWYIVCSTATNLGLYYGINDSNPYSGESYYYNGTGHIFTAPINIASRDTAIKIKVRR